ncbi:hypothetical protein V6Z12_D07G155500 [Gossypium hirsutum]
MHAPPPGFVVLSVSISILVASTLSCPTEVTLHDEAIMIHGNLLHCSGCLPK